MSPLFKTFVSLATAKAAIKTAGLNGMVVRYDDVTGRFRGAKNVQPVILCDLEEDKLDVEDRGFKAEMKRTQFEKGATVMLKPTLPEAKAQEMGVIRAMLTDIGGDVHLDRPIGGFSFWNVNDLFLVARQECEV